MSDQMFDFLWACLRQMELASYETTKGRHWKCQALRHCKEGFATAWQHAFKE